MQVQCSIFLLAERTEVAEACYVRGKEVVRYARGVSYCGPPYCTQYSVHPPYSPAAFIHLWSPFEFEKTAASVQALHSVWSSRSAEILCVGFLASVQHAAAGRRLLAMPYAAVEAKAEQRREVAWVVYTPKNTPNLAAPPSSRVPHQPCLHAFVLVYLISYRPPLSPVPCSE